MLEKVPDSALHSTLLIVRTSSPFLGISKKILTYFYSSAAVKVFSSALGEKAALLLPAMSSPVTFANLFPFSV